MDVDAVHRSIGLSQERKSYLVLKTKAIVDEDEETVHHIQGKTIDFA
jgi:hypothetical protein